MSFLRAVRDDLVEKKLWPVAVALLLALVAIPVLLARGGEEAPAAPLPNPDATAAPVVGSPEDPVVLAEASTAKVRPSGRFKDPFRTAAGAGGEDQAVAVDGAAVTVTPDAPVDAPAPAAGGGGGGDTSDLPAATTVTGPSDAGSTEPAAPIAVPDSGRDEPAGHFAGYRVDLDWGPAADPRTLRDVERLEILEVADEPQIVFMGVRPDGKTALFLLTGDSTGSGDAECRPSEEYCSLLQMRAGDSQFLDVVTADGVRQYELHVAKLAEKRTATAEAAQERLERVAKGGRKVVRDTIDGGRTFVRRYVYAAKLGVLRFVEDDEDKAAPRGLLLPAE